MSVRVRPFIRASLSVCPPQRAPPSTRSTGRSTAASSRSRRAATSTACWRADAPRYPRDSTTPAWPNGSRCCVPQPSCLMAVPPILPSDPPAFLRATRRSGTSRPTTARRTRTGPCPSWTPSAWTERHAVVASAALAALSSSSLCLLLCWMLCCVAAPLLCCPRGGCGDESEGLIGKRRLFRSIRTEGGRALPAVRAAPEPNPAVARCARASRRHHLQQPFALLLLSPRSMLLLSTEAIRDDRRGTHAAAPHTTPRRLAHLQHGWDPFPGAARRAAGGAGHRCGAACSLTRRSVLCQILPMLSFVLCSVVPHSLARSLARSNQPPLPQRPFV